MAIDDPSAWAQGAAALKTAFEGIKTAISVIKEVRSVAGGSAQQQKVIDTALTVASSNTAIAEAEPAKGFGYELCKCEFPPIPMRTVGYFDRPVGKRQPGDPVYECPKCGYSNAGPYGDTRTGSERKPSGDASS